MTKDCTGRLVSRTEGTSADYAKRYCILRLMAEREQRAGGDIGEVIAWFRGQNERWEDSTIRQYRASIFHELKTLSLHPDRLDQLTDHLKKGPTPRRSGPRRTSARKRKSLPITECIRIQEFLLQTGRADDLLIRAFVIFGPALFLRPSEYDGARLDGGMLIVRNAKATNGRANGEQRERDLAPLGDRELAALREFLHHLRVAVISAGGRKKLYDRLSARLARVCKALGIARISLYTLRHVGMATAKTWMTQEQVAAAAGHASVRTATAHYAKRRSGWRGLRLGGLPSTDSIARVRHERTAWSDHRPTVPVPISPS